MVVVKNNNPSEFIGEKVKGYKEYIGALEEEKRKIQVFERELPLCLDLVSQEIERYKSQMTSGTNTTDRLNGEFDQYFERISSEAAAAGPVLLEQFIPIKQTNEFQGDGDGDDDDEEQQEIINKQYSCNKSAAPCSTKSDWLTSTQLSIQPQDDIDKDLLSKKEFSLERNNNNKQGSCGAFHPFQKKQPPSMSSSADTDDGDDHKGQHSNNYNNKKQRRCWSPELHRRFLHALQQLGGAHVATPKQIRELMKVDGLTSDEIKSHLQKYRLHTTRLNPTTHHHDTPTHHRLVVVGQIWMPPLEYTTNAAASSLITDASNNTEGVYSPIATLSPSLYTRKITMKSTTPS